MSLSSEEKLSIDSAHLSLQSDKSIERAVSNRAYALKSDNILETSTDVAPLSEALHPTFSRNAASTNTTGTNNPDFEVDWDDDRDPMNPRNWPIWYKGMTIGFISWSTWCVVVYSTSYTTGLAQMGNDFHISSDPIVTLGVTSYRMSARREG